MSCPAGKRLKPQTHQLQTSLTIDSQDEQQPAKEIFIIIAVEEHLVVSTRDHFVNAIKAKNRWEPTQLVNPGINTTEDEISPADLSSRYLPLSSSTERELEQDSESDSEPEFERVPSPSPKLKLKLKLRHKAKPAGKPKKFFARVCRVVGGVRMSDASPSKRRKTRGAPMKTKKSAGKYFTTYLAQVCLLGSS
jgi:hypothetical protein